MKTIFKLATALCVGLVSSGPLVAQETVTLNKADYSVPAWTRLTRFINGLEAADAPFSINMTVNGDPTSRMAFAWFTNSATNNGKIQVVEGHATSESDFSNALAFDATSALTSELNYSTAKNMLDGIEPNRKVAYTSHKGIATGLKPATTYSFRVGTEGAWSEIGTFSTAAPSYPDGYEFIYITDTQAQNDEMFGVSEKTVRTAKRMVPNASFVLCNGDLVETSGASNSEWEYEQWFATMQDVWMNTPLVVTQGNHDSTPNNNFAWHFNNDNSYNAGASVPTAMDGTVFAVEYGDALFMVINYEDWKKDGYFESLAAWMRQQAANSKAKWRIASFHKNMFTGSRSHQDDADGLAVRNAMLPVFDELKIDLALQGHDHIYEVIGPVRNVNKTLIADAVENVEIISDGGIRENMTGKQGGVFDVTNGTLYFLNNSAGKKKYEPRDEQQMSDAIEAHQVENYWGLFSGKFGQTGEPTFSRVKVTTDSIHITTYTVDDLGNANIFDSFAIVKNKPSSGIADVSVSSDNNVFSVTDGMITTIVEGVTKMDIYSLSGTLMGNSKSSVISTKNLASGCYIVRAETLSKVYTAKAIIN